MTPKKPQGGCRPAAPPRGPRGEGLALYEEPRADGPCCPRARATGGLCPAREGPRCPLVEPTTRFTPRCQGSLGGPRRSPGRARTQAVHHRGAPARGEIPAQGRRALEGRVSRVPRGEGGGVSLVGLAPFPRDVRAAARGGSGAAGAKFQGSVANSVQKGPRGGPSHPSGGGSGRVAQQGSGHRGGAPAG